MYVAILTLETANTSRKSEVQELVHATEDDEDDRPRKGLSKFWGVESGICAICGT